MKLKLFYITLFFTGISFYGCSVTSYNAKKSKTLKSLAWEKITEIKEFKGPIQFQRVTAADWQVERGGLINLNDEKAQKAGLKSGLEPIHIYLYILDHPKFGRVVIDSGVGEVFKKEPGEWPVSSLVQSAMKTETLKVKTTTREAIKDNLPKAVFLTHMHLDHIMGLGDIPNEIPVYTGPGESSSSRFMNLFVQGTTDRIVGEKRNLRELSFSENPGGKGLPVLDYFGDGSLYIFWSTGHTKGSLVFLALSTDGPQLVLGDTCHTKWGWENEVPPGEFSENLDDNRKSLHEVKVLAEKIPGIKVYPGHQSIN